jgi:hypothetical protein
MKKKRYLFAEPGPRDGALTTGSNQSIRQQGAAEYRFHTPRKLLCNRGGCVAPPMELWSRQFKGPQHFRHLFSCGIWLEQQYITAGGHQDSKKQGAAELGVDASGRELCNHMGRVVPPMKSWTKQAKFLNIIFLHAEPRSRNSPIPAGGCQAAQQQGAAELGVDAPGRELCDRAGRGPPPEVDRGHEDGQQPDEGARDPAEHDGDVQGDDEGQRTSTVLPWLHGVVFDDLAFPLIRPPGSGNFLWQNSSAPCSPEESVLQVIRCVGSK